MLFNKYLVFRSYGGRIIKQLVVLLRQLQQFKFVRSTHPVTFSFRDEIRELKTERKSIN